VTATIKVSTIYPYPFPEREMGAGSEELLAAHDEPVDIVNTEEAMYVDVDCYYGPEEADSNLCAFDLGTTGYIRAFPRDSNGEDSAAIKAELLEVQGSIDEVQKGL